MIYYKVVKLIDGKLYSLYADYFKDIAIEYIPNKWVVPRVKNSKLFVYSSLLHADIPTDEYEVWSCEIADPEFSALQALYLSDIKTYAAKFWSQSKIDNFSLRYMSINKNYDVVLCSAVKLLKRVK
jgi:hypothetical protein